MLFDCDPTDWTLQLIFFHKCQKVIKPYSYKTFTQKISE